MRFTSLSLFSVIPLLLLACGKETDTAVPEAIRPALVQKLELSADTASNIFSGEVRARHEADMAFRIAGKIVTREVDVGTVVKPGTELARLDPADTALELTQVDAKRALAEADVKRYRDLRAKNFISQSALDTKEAEFKSVAAQADLARNQAAYAVLRADKAGVVTAVSAEPGQVVAAGQTVVRVARTEEPEVVINIPESRLQEFRAAKQLSVALLAAPDKRYQGRVRELSPVADAATRTFTARISVLAPDADVRLGMSANVVAGEPKRREIFSVPLSALTRLNDKPTVWVFDTAAQTVTPRAVKVENFGSEDHVNVVGGLKDGESIVTVGVHKLLPGQKVRPVAASANSS